MRNTIDNISSMFGSGSSSSSNIFEAIDLSQYSLIKSGTYGKLMKTYYAQNSKTTSDSTSKTDKEKETSTVDKTGTTKMKAEADSLKKTAEGLTSSDTWKTTAGEYDEDSIRKSISNFVDGYNSVIKQSSNITTDNTEISNNVKWMNSMTSTMSKQLSNVGIAVGTDGTLSINEDSFNKADMKNLKSLFSGTNSYAGQIENYASNIASAATTSTLYNNQASVYNTVQSILDVGI